MQHHKYSLTELEGMLPWEREIYVDLLVTHIKEENEKGVMPPPDSISEGLGSPQCIRFSIRIKMHIF